MTWALKIWNGLMFMLCRLVYLFIKWLYQVFEAVSKANLFTEEVFEELTGNIYLIMGIAMLFIFAYNLVLMIINPDDKKGTGSMTKVVKETIISLVAVVLLPTIFNYMYTFQSNVISSDIIGQLILGGAGTAVQDPSECSDGDYECKCDFSFLGSGGYAQEIQTECDKFRNYKAAQRGANIVPVTIFSAFYRPANFTFNECANHLANNTDDITGDDHDICVQYYSSYQMSKYTGKISYLIDNDNLKDGLYEDPQLMEFDHIFALLAGVLAVWMFLCYAMEIGVRVFKLGVLQLISPIPVMMRVVPGQKEKIYDKWFKELLNTYLDVFIRLIIIFFALFAVSLVPEMIETLWSSIADGDSNAFVKLLAMVIVILGILKFAQEAPELLKTFFGGIGGGKFSIRPKDQHGLNAIRAGVYGATTGKGFGGKVGGFFSGTARGSWGGYDKAVKGLDTIRTERGEKFGEGTTFRGRMLDRARVAVGMETRHERDKRKLAPDEKELKTQNDMLGEIKKIKDIVKNAIEKDDSKIEFEVDGIRGSYAKLHKIAETMLSSAQNMEDPEEQKRAFNKYTEFSKHIEEQKKEISKAATTNLLNGSKYQDEFKDKDFAAVGESLAKLNSEGLTLSGLTGDALSSLEDTVGKQAAQISKKINESGIYDEKYRARAADSRMIRGEGKAEKK